MAAAFAAGDVVVRDVDKNGVVFDNPASNEWAFQLNGPDDLEVWDLVVEY